MHVIPCAFVFAFASAGNNIPAKIAIIAITTSNSIKVNPRRAAEDFIFRKATPEGPHVKRR